MKLWRLLPVLLTAVLLSASTPTVTLYSPVTQTFRVEEHEQGKRCTISWRWIPAPKLPEKAPEQY